MSKRIRVRRWRWLHSGDVGRVDLAVAMSVASPRKPPSAAFWIAATLLAALVVYPLSFGPACWLADNGLLPIRPMESAFCPIVQLMADGPEAARRAIFGYASICGGSDTAARLDSNRWWREYGRRAANK